MKEVKKEGGILSDRFVHQGLDEEDILFAHIRKGFSGVIWPHIRNIVVSFATEKLGPVKTGPA